MSTGAFDDLRRDIHASRGRAAVARLEKRGFDARYFASGAQAVEAILDLVPAGSTVGAGGSVTLQELGMLERLTAAGYETVYHRPEMEFEESMSVRAKAVTCDYFLCSSNAVTMEGELLNTDGIGNRVCGMIFGPRTVVVIAGVNKLVQNREEAFSRIRNIAAPANARRLGVDVPCVERGYCVDCRSPMNICRITTILSGRPMWTDLKVFIVGEQLGL